MLGPIIGQPGPQSPYPTNPIDIFYGGEEDARFIPGPVTIDGTLSANPLNTPYIWVLYAGTLMGKNSTSHKYVNSVIGLSTNAYTSGDTSITFSGAIAAELVRRIGTSGKFHLLGGTAASGTVVDNTITFSGINTTTNVVTCTNLGANVIAGALIGADDGSYKPITLLSDIDGLRLQDGFGNRLDQFDAKLWAGGGMVDETKIVNWPTDTGVQAWIKARLRDNIPEAKFKGDLINQ